MCVGFPLWRLVTSLHGHVNDVARAMRTKLKADEDKNMLEAFLNNIALTTPCVPTQINLTVEI